jgi:TolB-like protein
MNKLILLFFVLFMPFYSFSQTELDKSLNAISTDLAEKLRAINKKKIVVLYITDINKTQTNTGKYLADAVSLDILNNPGGFQVFDRDNLDAIAGAKKLIAEGYIDAAKAKELGEMLSVEVIIVGTYTVLSNSIKLTLKALDVTSGFVVAGLGRDLPLDADTRILLFPAAPAAIVDTAAKHASREIIVGSGCATGNGSIRIFNRTPGGIQVIVSAVRVDLINNRMSRYELTYVAGSASEVVPELNPGMYYVCLIDANNNGFGNPVLQTKRIVVEACKEGRISF